MRWVLLPGLDGSGDLFRDFLRFVPDPYAIVVRYPDEASWVLDDYVRHAHRALPPESDCILVAESFSGPVALRLIEHARRVKGLVLVASFSGCPHPLLRCIPIRLVASLRRWASSRVMLRTFCLGHEASDDLVDALTCLVRTMPSAVLAARLRLLRSLNEDHAHRRIDVPRLLLRARRDRLVLESKAARATDRNARAEIIDGPHFLLQARAAECWRVIETWCASFDWRVADHVHDRRYDPRSRHEEE